MTHKPIKIDNISFILPHKSCFVGFSDSIQYGQRILVIGKNGCGKSTFLKMLINEMAPSSGSIQLPEDISIGYVPQIHEGVSILSGGQQFNRGLSRALMHKPNLLILDEPTNHLDQKNRASLLRMLKTFPHTLIISSHDVLLLSGHFDKLFCIEDGSIKVFYGNYHDYLRETKNNRRALEQEIETINKQTKVAHKSLMKEQGRAKKSRLMGEKNIEQRKWPTVVSKAKAKRAETTTGRKKLMLREKRADLVERLAQLKTLEIIVPKFYFKEGLSKKGTILSIQDGTVGYNKPVIEGISMLAAFGDRIALVGDNGSGKSTLLKALINDPSIIKTGAWIIPPREDIGYLDQNYQNLDFAESVLDTISAARPDWGQQELRQHLNNFLFRKNEEVNAKISTLSGGEKLRLSLCAIAANTPKLLLLDEVTNNVDLATKNHLTEVLSCYQGTFICISHDADFLKALKINKTFMIINGRLM